MQSTMSPDAPPCVPLSGPAASAQPAPSPTPPSPYARSEARSSRGPRALRGVLAASVASFVALLSHVAGGGAMPGWVGIVVPWVLAVTVCTLLAGRTLSLWRLSLAVIASQFLFHGLFILGMFGAPAEPSPALLSHHVAAAATTALPGLPQADLAMWLGHALAAAATTAALYRGERAIRRLLSLAAQIVHAVRRRVAAFAVGITRVPRRTVPGAVDAHDLAPLGWDPSSVARRGPPLPLSV